MIGLALEGGGSRGAYHIGVMKAYLEAGYKFDGFVGTSIGAINAAVFAQGDFLKAEGMWHSIATEHLFDADVCKLIEIGKANWDPQHLTEARSGLRKIKDGQGIDTAKIRELIYRHIDEQKIRTGNIDYGLVTVSISDHRPYELYLEDIPQGKLLSYIEASACFPGFKPVVIEENYFLDGALYNNCPINMLIKKGYDEIIAVRTKAPGVYRKFTVPQGVNVKVIVPKCDLGNMMIFSPEKIKENIKMGYLDGKESLKHK